MRFEILRIYPEVVINLKTIPGLALNPHQWFIPEDKVAVLVNP